LDLSAVPSVPSIFESIPDTWEYDPRPPAIFLNYFGDEVSKPITEEDRIHVEYIPTQVITEYFRTEFLHHGRKIDGIRYRSARRSGHCSLVLFATHHDLVGGSTLDDAGLSRASDPWIKLKTPPIKQHVNANDVAHWNREAPPGSNRYDGANVSRQGRSSR
jgi:RES domain